MDVNWDYPGSDESYGQATEESAVGNTPAKTARSGRVV